MDQNPNIPPPSPLQWQVAELNRVVGRLLRNHELLLKHLNVKIVIDDVTGKAEVVRHENKD